MVTVISVLNSSSKSEEEDRGEDDRQPLRRIDDER
jgi:hypothetical protein